MYFYKKILFIFIVIAFSGGSNAALVTTNGNSVSFTYDAMLVDLFGPANVIGDSLTFAPSNFKALSLNGSGQAFTNSSFIVQINSLSNNDIGSIALTENGDYELEGQNAKVAVKGELRAIDMADPLVTHVSKIKAVNPFVETDFDADTANWEANASLNFLPNTSSILVTIENILRAKTSSAGELAFVQKKFVGLTVTAVPLPHAVWLFGAGLLGLLSVSKRKRFI